MICFQELVKQNYEILQNDLRDLYKFVNTMCENDKVQFNAILLKKEKCKLENSKEILRLSNKKLFPNLLKIKLIYENSVKIAVMTTKLESYSSLSQTRLKQFNTCIQEMLKEDKDYHVILGGDTSLRM